MEKYVRTIVRLLLITSLFGLGLTVLADKDHDEARRMQESGAILPLQTILEKLRQRYPGKVLEVELEEESGQVIYEIEILGENGIVHEVIVDARTGEMLRIKQDD